MGTNTEKATLRTAGRARRQRHPRRTRFATGLFRESNLSIPDDQYLNEWTAVLAVRIDTHP
jgi:hypothetical protein